MSTNSRKSEENGWPLVIVGGLVLLYLYNQWNKQSPETVEAPRVALRSSASSTAYPPIGVGATVRGLRIGATMSTDSDVNLELGAGKGPFGLSITVITISLKNATLKFVLDNPSVGVAIGNRTLKLSEKNGFGQELGLQFPLKGHLLCDLNADLSTAPSFGPGHLTLEEGSLSFLRFDELGTTPSLKSSLDLPASGGLSLLPRSRLLDLADLNTSTTSSLTPPKYVIPFGTSGLWLPGKGYTWLDGGVEPRRENLAVQWRPGVPSTFPPHIHTSATEGQWEPDAGYRWIGGTDGPLPTMTALLTQVVWTPGVPLPDHPLVVTSEQEGQCQPAPGYTWATDAIGDLSVAPWDSQSR